MCVFSPAEVIYFLTETFLTILFKIVPSLPPVHTLPIPLLSCFLCSIYHHLITKYIPYLFSFGMQASLCLGFWTVLFTTLEEKLLEQCLVPSRCSMIFAEEMNEPPACMHVKLLLSCPTLCDPMNCSPQAPLPMGFSRQEYWSGLPCPPPGDFPDRGIKPTSLMFPVLAGGLFTTSTTWEAQMTHINLPIHHREQRARLCSFITNILIGKNCEKHPGEL